MRILYLMFLFLSKRVFSCKTNQNFFHITPNFKLSAQLIYTTADTLLACAHSCMKVDSCFALSYGHLDMVCVLHNETSIASSTLIYDNRFTYAAIECVSMKITY